MTDGRVKTSPQDFFLNLLSIVALYIFATSFGALLFEYVNYFFPNPSRYFYSENDRGIQFAVASLVVFFPVYLVSTRYLNRDVSAKKTRFYKWLTYFTLFITTLVILGDVVSIVFQFFSGDLTIRFLLKALIILFIGGSILCYYLIDAKSPQGTDITLYYSYFIVGLVIVSIIWSFIIAGTPQAQRDMSFDAERIRDLQVLQSEIVSYWQNKEVLPPNLGVLIDSISGFVPPVDPVMGDNYEYIVTGELEFELCGTFATESSDVELKRIEFPDVLGSNWDHGVGLTCFQRTIDSELYKLDDARPVKLL